jgi:hypothetical protein
LSCITTQVDKPADFPIMLCYERLCELEKTRTPTNPRDYNMQMFKTITETLVPKDLLSKVSRRSFLVAPAVVSLRYSLPTSSQS